MGKSLKAAMYLGVCFRKRAHWRLAQRNFDFLSPPVGHGAGLD